MKLPIVFHIPHASRFIPEWTRGQFLLDEIALNSEIDRMTDLYTDQIFMVPNGIDIERVVSYVSRLVTDVERFPIDDMEPMSELGMGMIYQMCSDGSPLRRVLTDEETSRLFEDYYRPHHKKLSSTVQHILDRFDACCLVDCHSYPLVPLPYEDQSLERPEVCIGLDLNHTSACLAEAVLSVAKKYFSHVALNTPFSGSLVSLDHWCVDMRVSSVMIEVRRDLYIEDGNLRLDILNKFDAFLYELVVKISHVILK